MSLEDAAPATQASSAGDLKRSFDPETFRWHGIEGRAYKFSLGDQRGMGWREVLRFTVGGPPEVQAAFELRYFEIGPGGHSSLEQHRHVHLVVAIRGRGKALVGERVVDLAPLDVLYVPPDTPHRWVNESEEPFGFLCPVDADRDPPRPIDERDWDALRTSPETAPYTF